jgi:hypothetical protein
LKAISSRFIEFVALVALLSSCSTAAPPKMAVSPAEASAPAEPAPIPPMPRSVLASAEDGAKVRIAHSGLDAQVEITSPEGRHVYIDVSQPSLLETLPTADDVLCTTHDHGDHRNGAFEKAFPGKWIRMEAGETLAGDLRITCLPSAHNEGDTIGAGVSTNYLFLIETGGLRILHTGDIGQLAYTEEQKASLGGRVDILFQQFENSYSAMSAFNRKGFILLADLDPRLVVPTHTSMTATRYQVEHFPLAFSELPAVDASFSALPEETTFLFAGFPAKAAWRIKCESGPRS